MALEINKINLIEDWLEIVKLQLVSENYSIEGLNEDQIFIEYFTIKNRKIAIKKRNVKKSREFSCPEPLQFGLSYLENKIINGEDLVPHQSRNVKKLNVKDGLLFDWNIYHFHLGIEIQDDGFIKRTGPLLYAYVDSDNIYFLKILEHGNWTQQDLIRVIHENWPEVIKHMKIVNENEDIILSHNATDEEIKILRNANINHLLQIDSKNVYVGTGWGFTSSGHSTSAVDEYLRDKRALLQIEKKLKESPESFLIQFFPSLDFIINNRLDFKLIFEDGIHKIIEKNNNFEIQLNK